MHAALLPLVLLAADVDAGADAGAAAAAPAPALPPRIVVAKQWEALRVPTPGPAAAIGACSLGCLQGAATLPASGPGYEVIRLSRNRRYGHPELISYVKRLGKAAKKKNVGLVVVGDLSQPRGGPTPNGHRSHQTGLDADISYIAPKGIRAGRVPARLREESSPPAVFDAKTHSKTPLWTAKIPKLLALAAADPAVDRIFVEPGIKKLMCEGPMKKAPWQGRLRPWRLHNDHFHVRLKCPAGSPECKPQNPPPDDGCGPSLAWWLGDVTRAKKKEPADVEASVAAEPPPAPPPTPATPPPPPPQLPQSCAAVMAQTKVTAQPKVMAQAKR